MTRKTGGVSGAGTGAVAQPDRGDAADILESEPAAAEEVFGARIDSARLFVEMLATEGERRGLVGPSELPRLWTRHVLNSAVVASLVTPGLLGDVGSGAGLPGIPLAIARPGTQVVLIEPMERRTEWLHEVVERLALENVEIVRGRAEDVAWKGRFDQVTARAVKPLATLLPWIVPLSRPGGRLLLLKGAGAEDEIRRASKVAHRLGVSGLAVVEAGLGLLDPPTRVVQGTVH